MADVMEYKCPACGGAMEFDSASQKLKCPYCDTEIGIEEYQSSSGEQEGTEEASWEAVGDGRWQEGETDGMRVYVCESCGGEIIAEETTGATACPYCGNKVVMKGQFSGDLRPDYIIPFKLDKKAAKAAYQKHLTGKTFMPGIFREENHIDEIKGVYIPFWLFDADVYANIRYKAERVKVWEKGDTEYTEHEIFDVFRSGKIAFQHIPTDGSRKMDDTLMESIEPYDFKDAVPFQPAYLAGYLADRYDVNMEERFCRATERMKKSAEDVFRDTVQGYSSVTTENSQIRMENSRYLYALYPVWLLSTTWRGDNYLFAMNGQTGKMVGDLPFESGAFWKYVLTRGVIIGAVIYALMWIIALI